MNQVADNFNSIQYHPLRTFNRAAMAFNLVDDAGIESSRDYLDQFTDGDKKAISIMCHYIKYIGVKRVREAVTKKMEFADV